MIKSAFYLAGFKLKIFLKKILTCSVIDYNLNHLVADFCKPQVEPKT